MWDVFAAGLIDAGRKEAFAEGIKAFIAMYFEEYSDAQEIDGQTWRALETLLMLGNLNVLDEDLTELVNGVTAELKASTGRTFTRYEVQT